LKGRIRNHYSNNKIGSAFRQLLGEAILRESNVDDSRLSHWEKKCPQPCIECKPTELAIKHRLEYNFSFRCIRIDDEDKRNAFEKKLIATISCCRVCEPSEKWLGRFMHINKVKCSRLWNKYYVFDQDQDLSDDDLNTLKEFVEMSLLSDQPSDKRTDKG
jgi:hypothetical protein